MRAVALAAVLVLLSSCRKADDRGPGLVHDSARIALHGAPLVVLPNTFDVIRSDRSDVAVHMEKRFPGGWCGTRPSDDDPEQKRQIRARRTESMRHCMGVAVHRESARLTIATFEEDDAGVGGTWIRGIVEVPKAAQVQLMPGLTGTPSIALVRLTQRPEHPSVPGCDCLLEPGWEAVASEPDDGSAWRR